MSVYIHSRPVKLLKLMYNLSFFHNIFIFNIFQHCYKASNASVFLYSAFRVLTLVNTYGSVQLLPVIEI